MPAVGKVEWISPHVMLAALSFPVSRALFLTSILLAFFPWLTLPQISHLFLASFILFVLPPYPRYNSGVHTSFLSSFAQFPPSPAQILPPLLSTHLPARHTRHAVLIEQISQRHSMRRPARVARVEHHALERTVRREMAGTMLLQLVGHHRRREQLERALGAGEAEGADIVLWQGGR